MTYYSIVVGIKVSKLNVTVDEDTGEQQRNL